MDRFVVRPSGPLRGSVRVEGAKNSALKLMAACLLGEGTSRLAEVPDIADVAIMSEVLEAIGADVERLDGHLEITTSSALTPIAPYELVEKMRASFVVLGPLLARVGRAKVSLPGGDDFGSLPIDIHLHALGELGARFTSEHGYVEGLAERLVGARIALDFPSHTATDNVLMAAVLAKGSTVIENAAREPEVRDLAALLTKMGARIEGAGTSRIEVEGVDELHPAEHTVISDRVEAATYLAAVAIAGGDVHVGGARSDDMDMYLAKLDQMGVVLEATTSGI